MLHIKRLDNFNFIKHFIWPFDSICIPLLKMPRHNNVKIYNAFFLPEFYVLFAAISDNVLSERWDN